MTAVRNHVGRRSFLIASITATASLALSRLAKAFNLIPGAAATGIGKKPLKAVVVYYSATGNTTKAAIAIHRGLSQVIDCDLLPLKKADPKKMAGYDLIGLGGPIWYSRETANLKLFAHNMPQMPGKLGFLFCTHGTGPDGFMWSLSQTVLKKSLTLIGWNDWYGSVFQVLHQPKPYMTDGHPDAIELQQAEAWGRELGERAQKIAVGDTKLIPEIPTGDNADTLWLYRGGNAGFMAAGARALPGSNGRLPGAAAAPGAAGAKQGPGPAPGGGPPGGMPMPLPSMVNVLPTIDMSKCVYPRCDACADACPVNAIDFSVNAPGRLSSGSNLLIKNACVSCSLCERMCIYDAAIHEGNGVRPKTTHAIDMKKCTYPKCTLCIDHCPMNSIDFSARPPVFHHNCEGCDLCYCICPTGAVSIPNINETQIAMRHIKGTGGAEEALNKAAAKGKFRWDVKPEDVGWDTPIFTNMNTPRIILDDLTGNTIYCDKPCKL